MVFQRHFTLKMRSILAQSRLLSQLSLSVLYCNLELSFYHSRSKKRGETRWHRILHADQVAVLEGFWSELKLPRKHKSYMSCGDIHIHIHIHMPCHCPACVLIKTKQKQKKPLYTCFVVDICSCNNIIITIMIAGVGLFVHLSFNVKADKTFCCYSEQSYMESVVTFLQDVVPQVICCIFINLNLKKAVTSVCSLSRSANMEDAEDMIKLLEINCDST